ncbi:MAG: HAMP domain-containing histidine kinase [Dysgonamonadaceae bacterium]|jgi:signal transduction histidine kinase|nr:HAMP domain-containing histidine kinase [Dysgonamonadaceae bacterium]
MKVQTRLAVFCSLVFGVIFILIAVVIFTLYYNNTQSLIYNNLKKITDISALFYLEEDELNEADFEKIKTQFREIVSGADYQVYNSDNRLVYGRQDFVLAGTFLDRIRDRKQSFFTTEDCFCYSIFYEDNQGDFVIIAKEKRAVLTEQVHPLLWILIMCFIIGLMAIILLSRWVSHIAYRPFSKVIRQVNNISAHNLDVQIESPDTKDELQELIRTFNLLLSKISETFIIQRNFVSYVSHEFKTPLASLIGNLEVFSLKDRTPEEYRRLSEKLVRQVNQMEKILDVLMIVSDFRKATPSTVQTRLDELLWEVIHKVTELYPRADIQVNLNIQPEEEALLSVSTEHAQLLLLLFNLVENAVKYSQGKPVKALVYSRDNRLCLSVTDEGIGIMPEHLANISKPFYRADHTGRIEGCGIGLSIALRIMEKNRIEYEIQSEVNVGTTITLRW